MDAENFLSCIIIDLLISFTAFSYSDFPALESASFLMALISLLLKLLTLVEPPLSAVFILILLLLPYSNK